MNEIIKKNGISYGIITGVVGALITTSIYSIDINLFTAWWLTLVNILIYITIAVVLLSKTKKELNFCGSRNLDFSCFQYFVIQFY